MFFFTTVTLLGRCVDRIMYKSPCTLAPKKFRWCATAVSPCEILGCCMGTFPNVRNSMKGDYTAWTNRSLSFLA